MSIQIPSIIIPSPELFIEGYYVSYSRDHFQPLASDNSLWPISVYEIWDNEEIYEDISQKINDLYDEFDRCEYHEDFSLKTIENLESAKKRIVEGIKILSHRGYKGLHKITEDLKTLFLAAKSYVNAQNRLKKVVEMVEKLSYRIIQLQVDIQTSSNADPSEFYEEQKECEEEMSNLYDLGANDEEMKRLRRLMEGVELDLEVLERFQVTPRLSAA